jgi:hypothetical protein
VRVLRRAHQRQREIALEQDGERVQVVLGRHGVEDEVERVLVSGHRLRSFQDHDLGGTRTDDAHLPARLHAPSAQR